MNIKVLKLDSWMKKYPEYFANEHLTEIQPYFNRDGYYLYGDVCWFEYSGRAWFVDNIDFKYGLMLFEVPYLRDCEIAAFTLLSKAHLISHEEERILWLIRQRENHRENSFGRRLRIVKLMKNRTKRG